MGNSGMRGRRAGGQRGQAIYLPQATALPPYRPEWGGVCGGYRPTALPPYRPERSEGR
jgi:hypothetical protein